MKKLYAVNSGLYSDYQVDAIFSTKKKAKDFMEIVPDSDYNEIEEYLIDPPVVDLVKRGYSLWSVHMLVDGTTERMGKVDVSSYNVTNVGHRIWKRSTAQAYINTGTPDILTSTVWAKTEKQAIKIVNEHRVQMIAIGQWK